ncbi:hypothetical protein H2199_002648 [Coniosporium tulheliwenetii]|uniref:Uncharacterized protein n=1 Tax=Coniosporium tulheliwenetii TaxID=3383036 RepID=A0ACC2ZHH7_9PEZI|nr:hypothetical protein H2199_002648 [Cladosporium sp. JES 115]
MAAVRPPPQPRPTPSPSSSSDLLSTFAPAPETSPGERSGAVIKRLILENEARKRELTFEIRSREELQRLREADKIVTSRLEAENSTLRNVHDVDERALRRRDRKIYELQAKLDIEAELRKSAEQKEALMSQQLTDGMAQMSRQLTEAKELQRRAEAHAKNIDELRRREMEEQTKTQSLLVLLDQQRQESSRRESVVLEMRRLEDAREKEVEELRAGAAALRDKIDASEADADTLRSEMKETLGQLRWAIGLEKAKRS